MRMLRLAIERYEGESDTPTLHRADLDSEDSVVARALSEIRNREASFLGNGAGAPDGDWERTVTDDVVRYSTAKSSDDFLRIRAQELSYSQGDHHL
jgi:hypothetical protein